MQKLIYLLLLFPLTSFGQWGEIPFYKDAKFIKNGKIRAIYEKSFFANGQGDITEQYFDGVYRFNKDGSISHEYRVYPTKYVDSVLYIYEKGNLVLEQHFSNRPEAQQYYEIQFSYDKKGLLEEKRSTYNNTTISYYYEKNILVQEVSGRDDSDVVTRTFYSKDGNIDKKTINRVIDGRSTEEEIELTSKDDKGNLTQEMHYKGSKLLESYFYKNYYTGTRLDGLSQYQSDMATINYTVAFRYNEKNWVVYESLKFHKDPPNNTEFSSIRASTFEYYLW